MPRAGSVVGWPSRSSAQPSGMLRPSLAAIISLPRATSRVVTIATGPRQPPSPQADAVARAAEVPLETVRRAAMLSGSLPDTAAAALRGGAEELAGFGLEVFEADGFDFTIRDAGGNDALDSDADQTTGRTGGAPSPLRPRCPMSPLSPTSR